MNIISFDVSKNELAGIRTNKSAKVLERFIVPNNYESINNFIVSAKDKYPHLMVSSEATADYHRDLARSVLHNDIPFTLINPILTKQFTRSTIRKKKTDATDALIIAKLTLQGEGSLLNQKSLDPLKPISRTTCKIGKLCRIFEAINNRFNRVFPDSSEVLAELKRPIAPLRECCNNLKRYVEKHIDEKLKNLLASIIGIGPAIASTLVVEIGEIGRFPDGKSLVAYAGLDPKVRQSGLRLNRNTKITKRGSAYLRRSIFIAASIAARHDPELKEYYLKKIKEGKRYKEAMVAISRKIIYRVYAVWKRGTPYQKRYPQINT